MRGRLMSLTILLMLMGILVLPPAVDDANAFPNLCNSIVEILPGPHCWVVCPEDDGPPLNNLEPASGDATISLTILDLSMNPIVGIPASDFWLVGENFQLALCGGQLAINATGPTDGNGQTTIAGSMAAGGCDTGVQVVVQGIVFVDPVDCVTPIVLDILAHSPDGDGDLQVINIDFAQFGNAWEPLGGFYDPCMDFDCDGHINAIDFTAFGNHWQHRCL